MAGESGGRVGVAGEVGDRVGLAGEPGGRQGSIQYATGCQVRVGQRGEQL